MSISPQNLFNSETFETKPFSTFYDLPIAQILIVHFELTEFFIIQVFQVYI